MPYKYHILFYKYHAPIYTYTKPDDGLKCLAETCSIYNYVILVT
jgi:hypothetical protein